MAITIHPTALVDKQAQLADNVDIGPYTIIEKDVQIGSGTQIGAHCVVGGHTTIGSNNKIYPFVSLGLAPQDKKYAGEPTRLEIGDHNTIRECCTLNIGTIQDQGVTRIGNHNWIMAYVHIAHDCQLASHITIANSTQLAGHVHIDDFVVLGGFTGVHQFCRIGAYSMTSVGTVLLQDLPPYVMADGDPASPRAINTEGLKRRGFDSDAILAIRRAYKTLYRKGLGLEEAKALIQQEALIVEPLKRFSDFLNMFSHRGIIR
ncbi:MAG: acyl-ACP--UDP-N-acetylglucosamine O-acyltransferase [Pseudomonadota bacterium]